MDSKKGKMPMITDKNLAPAKSGDTKAIHVFLIGSGAREHAIAWKLAQSDIVEKLLVFPGNAGTRLLKQRKARHLRLEIYEDDFEHLAEVAREKRVTLVIVDPTRARHRWIDPIEHFQKVGIPCFCPSPHMTKLEGDKSYAKDFMLRHNVPTAPYAAFEDLDQAIQYVRKITHRVVIKSDQIVKSQRVFLPETKFEAYGDLTELHIKGAFGPRRARIVVEKHLQGREISVMCFSDGKFVNPVGLFCNRKHLYDGDKGELSAGMGVYSPPPFIDKDIIDDIDRRIIRPTFTGFRQDGVDYKGCLMVDIMLTEAGPMVLGYDTASKSKHSRVVVSQSKKGCVTCKARRIKCDEHKPMCWRCIRGGRLCGGYGYEREAQPAAAVQSSLKDGAYLGKQAERLSHLASLVMSLDRNGQPLHDDRVWERPFLQLSHAVDCVKAAAAAFGAAYESQMNGHIPQDHPPALYYYGSALQQLQASVNNGTAGAESCALASLILACVEILSQQEQNAFAHFLGACQILDIRRQLTPSRATSNVLKSVKQELVMLDILIGSYTMSQTPAFMQLEPQETATTGDAFSQPRSAIEATSFSLHRAYRFIGRAGPYRYRHLDYVESDPVMRRDRAQVVSELRSVYDHLERLTIKTEAQVSTVAVSIHDSTADLAEMYALRCQVTSALIFILSVHSPFETTYDRHQSLFRNVISDAAASIRTRRRFKSGVFSHFSCRPGVLAPLFLVSIKCRDPSMRRLATSMLKEQGREGPADGKTLAAVGTRLAELEESAGLLSPSGSLQNACDIPERHRIHGYYVDSPQLIEAGKVKVRIGFSMAHPSLLEGWGIVDYAAKESWSFRSETLEL